MIRRVGKLGAKTWGYTVMPGRTMSFWGVANNGSRSSETTAEAAERLWTDKATRNGYEPIGLAELRQRHPELPEEYFTVFIGS